MYTPIVATLGYILSDDKSKVLLIHRNKRPEDPHLGKYNGLGGRLEKNEDVVSGMCREIQEESGLVVDHLILRGTISWPGFGKSGEDWLGFIFRIEKWHGEIHEGNHEGTLEWVPVNEILNKPLWPGDHYFLGMVFDEDSRAFHGCMPYEDGQAVNWTYQRI